MEHWGLFQAHQRLGKRTGRLRNQVKWRPSGIQHKNTEKSPGDFRRLVIQTLVKKLSANAGVKNSQVIITIGYKYIECI